MSTPDPPPAPPNKYKSRAQWPPDLSRMSPQEQFAYERKFRRRQYNQYMSPRWMAGTKILQWGSIGFVVFYSVFFMEPEGMHNPFVPLRRWTWEQLGLEYRDKAARERLEREQESAVV